MEPEQNSRRIETVNSVDWAAPLFLLVFTTMTAWVISPGPAQSSFCCLHNIGRTTPSFQEASQIRCFRHAAVSDVLHQAPTFLWRWRKGVAVSKTTRRLCLKVQIFLQTAATVDSSPPPQPQKNPNMPVAQGPLVFEVASGEHWHLVPPGCPWVYLPSPISRCHHLVLSHFMNSGQLQVKYLERRTAQFQREPFCLSVSVTSETGLEHIT